jgi:hypothetical protein
MIKPINLVSVAIISPTLGSIKNKHEQKDEAVYNTKCYKRLRLFITERVLFLERAGEGPGFHQYK